MDFETFFGYSRKNEEEKEGYISAKVIEDLEIDGLKQIRGKIKNEKCYRNPKWSTLVYKSVQIYRK